ncbi:MAG: TIGR00153 family protein [Proteobacteria bacterium]|nr:TIGR00153 family protein [Pseudomonadota bacterium]
MRSLTALFGQSPFGPLQQHMEKAAACAEEVPALVDALIAGDMATLESQRTKISALESEADAIKNDLRNHLPRRLFMPVARRDLLEILDLQDTIADVAEDIADLFVERKWTVPEAMQEPLVAFTRRAVDATVAAREVMRNLDELVEVGFSGPESEQVLARITAVNQLEDESDELELELTRTLFRHEDEMSAVAVILWMRIFEWIGDLADYPKKVCNRLRLLIAN